MLATEAGYGEFVLSLQALLLLLVLTTGVRVPLVAN